MKGPKRIIENRKTCSFLFLQGVCMDYRCIAPTRSSCTSDRECPSTENCVNGDCVHPCDNPSACGVNAGCEVYQHQKQCTCPEGIHKFSIFTSIHCLVDTVEMITT